MEYKGKLCLGRGKGVWTKKELLEECKKRGLTCRTSMNKTRLCQILLTGVGPRAPDKGTSLLNSMPVSVTGARSGEILFGIRNTSSCAMIEYKGSLIRPFKGHLDFIRDGDWKKFIHKLGKLRFFKHMTFVEREKWLEKNQSMKKVEISEVPQSKIKVLDTGSSNFGTKLTEKNLEELYKKEFIDTRKVRSMFPRKPGSRAARQTLIFLSSFWKVTEDKKECSNFNGILFDIERAKVLRGEYKNTDDTLSIVRMDDRKVGILYSDNPGLNRESIIKIILRIYPDMNEKDVKSVEDGTETFTPAGFKSLIQKIIRFRPLDVEINNVLFSSGFVLIVSIGLLIINPGSFVPNIQKFVSGLESATKRLVVTIIEDSYADNSTLYWMLSLCIASYLARIQRTWKPSDSLVETWFIIAINSLREPRVFDYDNKLGLSLPKYTFENSEDPSQYISAFMDQLKSFKSDLAMIRDVARSAKAKTTIYDHRPEVMPLTHCIDHHWIPEIVYFFSLKTVKESKTKSGKPFNSFFWRLFFEGTGVNPRKRNDISFVEEQHKVFEEKHKVFYENMPFVVEMRKAQRLVLECKIGRQKEREASGSTIFPYILDRSWISGLVGPMEIKMKPSVMVTISPSDPEILIPMKRPSRDMKTGDLTEEQKEIAITKANILLRKGVLMNKAKAPVRSLENMKLYLKNSIYYVGRKRIPWEKAREVDIPLTIYPQTDLILQNGVFMIGNGVEEKSQERLLMLIEAMDISSIRRALGYLSGYKHSFEMNRISRDGGSIAQSVVQSDVGAYHFLLYLSLLYPGALRKVKGSISKFEIPIGPLMWTIRDFVSEMIKSPVSISGKWSFFSDRKKRKMWEHQEDSLEEMKERYSKGLKGNFLWIPVGMGKTMIVMEHIKHVDLPLYIIYALPSSAIKSVYEEIKAYTDQVHLVVPLKSIKHITIDVPITQGCSFMPHTVNMIEHDHLRRCEETLLDIAQESFVVIDEVHKTLNETKRTSMALNICRLSRDFIALTGTPIIDTKTYKLAWWLEQIVPFEINKKNFWVGANGMISRKVNTGVHVERTYVEAKFTNEEEEKYAMLIENRDKFREAIQLCYVAATREMINQTMEFLKENIGVVIVAKDYTHQSLLYELMKTKIPSKDIFVLKGADSIIMTDEAVSRGDVPDYKVVIVPLRKSLGYTLTKLSAMVTSVYPSNNATRTQIEGRINRIGQANDVHYRIIHIGILTYIMEKYKDARNIEAVLRALAKNIEFK